MMPGEMMDKRERSAHLEVDGFLTPVNALHVGDRSARAGESHRHGAPNDSLQMSLSPVIADPLPFQTNKIRTPRTAPDILYRKHLFTRLDAAVDRSITLVTAAAGYGKTSLLASWLEECPVPHAWLSLDRSDSDVHTFATYLVAAVRSVFPGACTETLAYLTAKHPLITGRFTGLLCKELDTLPRRMVLVLDDFHLVSSLPILEIVSWLLYRPLRNLHLVIAGRSDPFLPLTNLRARGELAELRGLDLRFTQDESAEFLLNAVEWTVPAPTIELLYAKTDGWIAGLRLAATALARTGPDDAVASTARALNQGVRHILDFFAEDVIVGLPREVQEMLLAASLPEEFCGDLCNAMLPMRPESDRGQAVSGLEFVKWLTRTSLFVTEVRDGPWLKFHPLFRQVLRQLLPTRYGSREIAACHLRLADWYAQQGMLPEAMIHCLESGDMTAVERMAARNLTDILNREDRPTLESWAMELPEPLMAGYPALAVIKAYALVFRWEAASILPLVDDAEISLKANQSSYDASTFGSILSSIYLLKSHHAYSRSEPDACLDLARLSYEQAPKAACFVRGFALLHTALAMQNLGNEVQALKLLNNELETTNSLDPYRHYVHLACAQIYAYGGNWIQVTTAAKAVLSATARNGHWISRAAAHCLLGRAAFERGELDTAADFYRERAHLSRHADTHSWCASLFGQIAVLIRKEEYDAADELLAQVREVVVDAGNLKGIAAATAFGLEMEIAQGDTQAAGRRLDQHRVHYDTAVWQFAPVPTCHAILVTLGDNDRLQEALACVDAALLHADEVHSDAQRLEALVVRAVILTRMADHKGALEMVQIAVPIASQLRARRLFLDYGVELSHLLRIAARNQVCPVFVTGLLDEIAAKTHPVRKASVQPAVGPEAALVEPLSFREMDVLELLAERLSNKEIAERLVISVGTVRAHTTNIYQKLQVSGRRQAVAKAAALRILS